MLIDVFVISMCWLLTFVIAHRELLTPTYYLRSFFPSFFENNWYITSYILFCLIVPFINIVIRNINKKTHLISTIALLVAYFVIDLFYVFPWASTAILWITIYFLISFLKVYRPDISNNKKLNLIVLVSAIIFHILFLYLMNYLFLHVNSVHPIKFVGNNNIVLLLIAVTSFNLVRQFKFRSRAINYISSLTLYIYLIHENLMFREQIRPRIIKVFMNNFGVDYMSGWLVVIALTIFAGAIVLSIIYRGTIKRLVDLVVFGIFKAWNKRSALKKEVQDKAE